MLISISVYFPSCAGHLSQLLYVMPNKEAFPLSVFGLILRREEHDVPVNQDSQKRIRSCGNSTIVPQLRTRHDLLFLANYQASFQFFQI